MKISKEDLVQTSVLVSLGTLVMSGAPYDYFYNLGRMVANLLFR